MNTFDGDLENRKAECGSTAVVPVALAFVITDGTVCPLEVASWILALGMT